MKLFGSIPTLTVVFYTGTTQKNQSFWFDWHKYPDHLPALHKQEGCVQHFVLHDEKVKWLLNATFGA